MKNETSRNSAVAVNVNDNNAVKEKAAIMKKVVSSKKSETIKNNVVVNATEVVMKKSSKKAAKVTKAEATIAATVKFADLSIKTVMKLDGLANDNMETSLEMGKIIHAFVLKVTKNYEITVDAHKMLEKCPGSQHKADMLRKLEGGFMLREELKANGVSISLSMSHLIAVLNSKLNYDAKASFLKDAEENKLSVSELKKKVAEAIHGKKPTAPAGKIIIDYKKMKGVIANCFDVLSAYKNANTNQPLPEDVISDLGNLITLANAQGSITSITPTETTAPTATNIEENSDISVVSVVEVLAERMEA